jgi:hypothetical protein
MSRKLTSMLVGVAAVALLAAPAAARTAHTDVHHAKAKLARTYVQYRPGVTATNAFQHYDDIFVLDP